MGQQGGGDRRWMPGDLFGGVVAVALLLWIAWGFVLFLDALDRLLTR